MTFKIVPLCLWVVALAVQLIRVSMKQKPEWFDVFVPTGAVLIYASLDVARG